MSIGIKQTSGHKNRLPMNHRKKATNQILIYSCGGEGQDTWTQEEQASRIKIDPLFIKRDT